ncbi:MAG: hypothetical protein BWY28_00439 [bacterium ADurb.Bin236]|nr:MAG: hypothetical protein BWY28_00439 [bacterium ADurb.Bin236]HPN94385.1 AAA family ATPase [bacterium]
MHIESISIRNYRVFREANMTDIPSMCVLVGANGTGKSTMFDVFGFLRDALTHNVDKALAMRGGFNEVISRNAEGPVSFEIKFREVNGPLVTYSLSIGLDSGRPVVASEVLKYRRGQHGQPWKFLEFSKGHGQAITNEDDYKMPESEMQREPQELESPDILAIKGLGQFQRFKVVTAFRKLIENWHVSDFHIHEARPSHEEGYAEHLSARGENLALVSQFLYDRHRDIFDEVLRKMAERVPGVSKVEAQPTIDGRIVLRFQDGSFKDPFIARYVSDGTIKMFAYLVLLHDPSPHPLLCVEEPENQLYPQLLQELAEEFRQYSERGGQVFVSTHSPDFLNGTRLDEVFYLRKMNGFTTLQRARDSEVLRNLVAEGELPGALWKQGLFEEINSEL